MDTMKYTFWELTIDKKNECYVLEKEWEDGNWSGGEKGEKIYFVDHVYVWMGMNFKPKAVFPTKEIMIHVFVELFGNNYKTTE